MFTIVISEKGGAERRESFEKNEINVGRVQGNDLMLPKGNVSKHHARLLYRDGRFIVTDLKSTNGTYVNGRKISQATIVREGDKIYIGDFVLRLETGAKSATAGASGSGYDPESDALSPEPAIRSQSGPRDIVAPVAGPAGSVAGSAAPSPGRPLPPPLPPGAAAPAVPPPLPSAPRVAESEAAVSHYPLERDPDEGESSPELGTPAGAPMVPAPPRVPQTTDPRTRAGNTMVLGGDRAPVKRPGPAPSSRAPRSVPPPAAASRPIPRETPQQAARRLALITLIDRVADAVDLTPLEQSPVVAEGAAQPIERAVRDQAKAMREEGEAPEGIDLDVLARDALRELVGLGPLAPLLDDDETSEIQVVRPDCVLAVRGGQIVLADPSFTSEVALARIVARLAHQSGEPLHEGESVVDRRLPRSAYMTAIGPPTAGGWVIRIGKRRPVEVSLSDLVRSGSMSEGIAKYLEDCAHARANVLVVAPGARPIATHVCAVLSAVAAGERVAVLQSYGDDLSIPQAHVIPIVVPDHGPRGAQAVYAAARLGVDRLALLSLGGEVATAAVDVIAEGAEGVLAGVAAPTLGHGLARAAVQLTLARAGSSIEAARYALAASFQAAVEIEQEPSGRTRVRRVVEFDGVDERGVVTRDLFVLNVDATPDNAYVAAGVSQFLPRAGE